MSNVNVIYRLAVRVVNEWVTVFAAPLDTMENAVEIARFHRVVLDANPNAIEVIKKDLIPELSKGASRLMGLPDPIGHIESDPPKLN